MTHILAIPEEEASDADSGPSFEDLVDAFVRDVENAPENTMNDLRETWDSLKENLNSLYNYFLGEDNEASEDSNASGTNGEGNGSGTGGSGGNNSQEQGGDANQYLNQNITQSFDSVTSPSWDAGSDDDSDTGGGDSSNSDSSGSGGRDTNNRTFDWNTDPRSRIQINPLWQNIQAPTPQVETLPNLPPPLSPWPQSSLERSLTKTYQTPNTFQYRWRFWKEMERNTPEEEFSSLMMKLDPNYPLYVLEMERRNDPMTQEAISVLKSSKHTAYSNSRTQRVLAQRLSEEQIQSILDDGSKRLNSTVYRQLLIRLWNDPGIQPVGPVGKLLEESLAWTDYVTQLAPDQKFNTGASFSQTESELLDEVVESLEAAVFIPTFPQHTVPFQRPTPNGFGARDQMLFVRPNPRDFNSREMLAMAEKAQARQSEQGLASNVTEEAPSSESPPSILPPNWQGSEKEWAVLNKSLKLIKRYGVTLRDSTSAIPQSLATLVETSRQILVDALIARSKGESVLIAAKQVVNGKWDNNWQTLLDQMQFTEVNEALQSATHTTRNASGDLIEEAETTQEILEDQGPFILYGNKNDTLTGGAGQDIFVVHRGLEKLHIQSQGDSIENTS